MKFHHRGRYEGDWKEGLPNGYGVEILPERGGRYCGMFKDGLRSGFGKMSFPTGEWLAGRPNGRSSHRTDHGTCNFYREFKNGDKHGLGRVNFGNGDQHAGEYFGNRFQGYGVYQYANGDGYEGSWHEGRIQGVGMFTSQNGDVNCGEWDLSILMNCHPKSSEHVINAVKPARIVAEKASGLPFANEDVESAVKFATAIANSAQVTAENAVIIRAGAILKRKLLNGWSEWERTS